MLSSTISRLNILSKPSICHACLTIGGSFKRRKQRLWNPISASVYSQSNFTVTSRVSSLPIQASASENDLVVLGIETSCDDTAAAVVRGSGEILSQVISSQAELLAQYGGVAPKMAEEAHSLVIDRVVEEALDKANLTPDNLSAVAVTIGPGLGLCLRVGVRKAHKLAGAFNLAIIGVHHMEAHALVARRMMMWRARSSTTEGGQFGSSDDRTGGGTRLVRAIRALQARIDIRFQELRNNLPLKLLFFLVGFYSATAFATMIGQTGDWDILSAALAVAVVEAIGALMYKGSLRLFSNLKSLVIMFNYWKAGLSLGLFLDSFKF